jgi:uncharacterized protein
MKRWYLVTLILLSIILCSIPTITAQNTGHISLLAVSEATDQGSVADLYLTIQDGRGGIYIETAPLTKLDTQLSTRFAQQIGCNFIDQDCLDTDFFYTIRSDAAIIGGPSAGAGIAAMTIAMLDDREINESVSITGTINVGGLIGPVSGIIGKIDAAEEAGITKVLIPKGTRYEEKRESSYNKLLLNASAPYLITNNETNITEVDAFAYGEFIGIEVKEIATLQEAAYEITGHWYEKDESITEPPDWYRETMKGIAQNLCERNRDLTTEIKEIDFTNTNATVKEQIIQETMNSTIRAENATAYDQHYVAASTCFGSNIRLQYQLLEETEEKEEMNTTIIALNQTLEELRQEIDGKELKTITDLQTYLVVNQRLKEAEETLNTIRIKVRMNNSEDTSYEVAYATERLFSASAWAHFFNNNGKELKLDQKALKESCNRKLAETQERYQYVRLNTLEGLDKISTDISLAYLASDEENYFVCLDMASRAKANLDIIMSLIGVQQEEELTELVEDRLQIARQVLNKQKEDGYFPMLGYSYYEYAEFLKEKQPYSALIYSHYALEFSNIDMYFQEKQARWYFVLQKENVLYFAFGFGIGIVFCCIIGLQGKRKKRQ